MTAGLGFGRVRATSARRVRGVVGQRRRRLVASLLVLGLVSGLLIGAPVAPVQAAGPTATLDPTFGTAGVVSTGFTGSVEAAVVQPDGKTLTVGTATFPGPITHVDRGAAVARHLADGSLDPSFGSGGIARVAGLRAGTDLALQPDGGIVVVGSGSGVENTDARVGRLLTNGTMDATFGDGGVVSLNFGGYDWAEGVAIDPSGSAIAVAGASSTGGEAPVTQGVIALLRSDGSLDSGFGGGSGMFAQGSLEGSATFNDVAWDSAGRIIGAGGYDRDWDTRVDVEGLLVRLDASGLRDASFNGVGIAIVGNDLADDPFEAVAVDAHNRVVAVANSLSGPESASTANIFRFSEAGEQDHGFGWGVGGVNAFEFFGVAIDGNEGVVAVGREYPETDTTAARSFVVRLDDTGSQQSDDDFLLTDLVPAAETAGNEGLVAAAFQPDGALVVAGGRFASGDSPGGATNPRYLLARFGAPDRRSVVAGEAIVFASNRGNGDGSFDIWTVDPDGTGLRNLTNSPGVTDTDPSFSPDGSQVVFVSQVTPGVPQLWVLDVASGVTRQLTNVGTFNADPAWSPDGRRIAFTSFRNGGPDVFTIDADRPEGVGNPARNLTQSPSWDSFPTWAPDGRVVYQSNLAEAFNIWAVPDVDTEVPARVQLTTGPDDQVPAVSPDGETLLFARTVGGDADLYLVRSTGENVDNPASPLFAHTADHDTFGTFSPDGSLVVFGRESGAPGDGSSRLLVAPVKGGGAVTEVFADAPGVWSQGASWSGVLTILASTDSISASPQRVPLRDIPLQPESPAMETAPLDFPPLAAPLDFPPLAAPLDFPPLAAPIDRLPQLVPLDFPPLAAPLDFPPLAAAGQTPGVPFPAPLDFPPLAAAAEEQLKHVPFSSLVITAPGGHRAIIHGPPGAPSTALANRALQDLSVQEVLADPDAGPRLRRLQLHEVSLANSPLRGLGLGMVLLGRTRLRDIGGVPWCSTLQSLGYTDANCEGTQLTPPGGTSALDATLIDLQLAGVPFNDPDHPVNVQLVRLGQISIDAAAPLLYSRIGGERILRDTVIGSVRLDQITDAELANVLDSSSTCQARACAAGATLWGAHQNQNDGLVVNRDAPLRTVLRALHNVTLGQLIFGLAGIDAFPYEEYPVEQLGVLGHGGESATSLTQRLLWRAQDAAAPRVTIRLTPNSSAIPSSAELSINDQRVDITPSISATPDGIDVTWQLPGMVSGIVEASIEVRPGVRLGNFAAQAVVVAGGAETVALGDPVEVTESGEPDNSPAAARTLAPGTLYISHAPNGDDYWKFPAPAEGTLVEVTLGNRSGGDNDLVVYYPPGTKGVGDDARLRAASAASARVQPLPDQGADQSTLGEPLAAETRNDIDIAPLPVAGISDQRSRANEVVRFIALGAPVGGAYTVQVAPYLRDASFGPYTLRVRFQTPAPLAPCPARPAPSWSGATLPAASTPASDRKSLFLVNRSRLVEQYGATAVNGMLGDLGSTRFLEHAKVKGVVVPVDSNLAVQAAYNDAAGAPCDAGANNKIVRAINDLVDATLAGSAATIENIVIVGGPEVIPQALVPDATQTGNELLFGYEIAPLFGSTGNPLTATGGNVRSDDPYGDFDPEPYGSRFLYKPDVAIGRLLESPDEIRAPILAMVGDGTASSPGHGGTIPANSSFSAGGYFMKDLATQIDANLASKVANHTLNATDDWTRADLANLINAATAAPNVIAVNTHANPFALGPPGDPTTPFTATDLNAAKARLGLSVLLSIGCHSLTSVFDGYSSADLTDFAQVMAGSGGTAVGQYGYGLGLANTLAFSEEVMVKLTENFGQMSIGQALMLAKNDYLAQGVSSPYQEKAAVEAAIVGLPMVSLGIASSVPPPQTKAVATGTDASTGAATASVSVTSDLNKVTTDDGSYYEGRQQGTSGRRRTHTIQQRPIGARIDVDVSNPDPLGGRATGVFITGRVQEVDGTATEPVNPVFVAPALSGAGATPVEPQSSDVIYPAVPHGLVRSRAASGPRDLLSINPTQFRSTGLQNGKGVGQFVIDRRLEATLFYGTSDPARAQTPVIDSIEAAEFGQVVSFQLRAHDPDGGDIKRASVLFADSAGWHYLELSPTATPGTFTGAAGFAGTDPVEYIGQVLDDEAWSGITANKGRNFRAMQTPPTPTGVTAAIVGATPTTTGWYGGGAEAQLTSTDEAITFDYRLDGGDWTPYTGPVPVSGDGLHSFGYRTSDNRNGVLAVPIDTANPTASISSPTATTYGVAPVARFSCADSNGIHSCVARTASGQVVANNATIPVVGGSNTLTVTATDVAGHTASSAVTFTFQSVRFEGFFAPIDNVKTNEGTAGRKIPVKWRLWDAQNQEIKSLTAVSVEIKLAFPSACPSATSLLPNTDGPFTVLDPAGLKYDGTQYHYNWETTKLMTGCWALRLNIQHGPSPTVYFNLR